MVKAVAMVALVLLVAAGPVSAQSLDDVLREVEGVYGRMTDLRADFTQVAFNKSLNQSIPAKGTVYLKKGGKLRTEFQVRFLNPAQPKDTDGNWVLDLTPKQPLPTLARLILALDAKSWEIKKAVVHDQFENTVTMRFTKMAVNSGLPDRTFTFVAPKGVVIVPFK